MKLTKIILNILVVYNKLSLETIKKTNEHKINKNEIINFQGPLNFLRGYYYNQNNMILKKRLYSPELEYELKIEEIDNVVCYMPPNYRKIKIKKYEECKEKEIKYVEGYHKVLSLFFQYNEQISVINNGTYSFYKFINSKEVKKESGKLFAALLLIGEGVEINLKIEKKNKIRYLVLKEKVSFKLPLSFQTINGEMSYSSVQDIVKVFTSQLSKWTMFQKKADSAEEFSEGLYTMSPNFIMQAYLHELLEDKAEKLIEIVEYCHVMMEKYKNKYEKVYSRCFINIDEEMNDRSITDGLSSESDTNINTNIDTNIMIYGNLNVRKAERLTLEKANNDLEAIEKIKTSKSVLPFDDSGSLPKYASVKLLEERNKPQKANKYSESETYPNCCEISIFSMLSLLFYDKNKKKYDTEHLNNEASKEMIEFFTTRSNPRQISFNSVFHQEWSDILVNLPCDKIRYAKNKNKIPDCKMANEVRSGIINTLRVICSLCGLKNELIEIQDVEKQMAGSREKQKILVDFIKQIFKKISVNKNYEISVLNLYQIEINNIYDYTGTIQLKYNEENVLFFSAKLVVLPKHQYVELWTREAQFSVKAKMLIKKYKKNDCLIGELHNNLLHRYSTQNHKYDLENRVFEVLEAKDESYISLCARFGLILNDLNSDALTGLNAIHIFLILRIRDIHKETKKMFNSEIIPVLLSRQCMPKFLRYARNSSEPLFRFFLSLFNNLAVSHDINEDHYRNSFLMPLLLFDKECVYFEHIKISNNQMLELFYMPDILNLLLELNYSIVPDLWVMEFLKDTIKLSIDNFENGENLIFPDIFFSYNWDIKSEMLRSIVSIYTEYIKNRNNAYPSKLPHPFLFPLTPDWQRTFIYYDADKTIGNSWPIFFLSCFDHCCYVESLDYFKSRLISKDSDFYASYPNYIFSCLHDTLSWLFELTTINPIQILSALLNSATYYPDFLKLFFFYVNNYKTFGFFSLYNIIINSTTKFYDTVEGTRFFYDNTIGSPDNITKNASEKLIHYMSGYYKFLNHCIIFFNNNKDFFLRFENISENLFKSKIDNLQFMRTIIDDYIKIIENTQ